MKPVGEAIELILSHAQPLPTVAMGLADALGTLVAEPVQSDRNVPGYDNSAMDGIGFIHPGDGDAVFKLVGEFAAGAAVASDSVDAGSCVKIMTGGPVPPGVDTIAPREIVTWEGETATVDPLPAQGANVRCAGEDIAKGSTLDLTGRPLGPGDLGVLASLGFSTVQVHRRPRVAIFGTGAELVDPDEELKPGQVVNSNNWTLAASARLAGAEPVVLGKTGDTRESIREAFERARDCDIVCSTGGVSVGDYDFVKEVLEDIGAEILFWKVALKPGKPLAFGTWENRLCFGLPGNPVSCMVNFEMFVLPAIRRLSGWREPGASETVRAVLAEDFPAVRGRTHAVRAVLSPTKEGWSAAMAGGQGSGQLSSMSRANALIFADETLSAGTEVEARLLLGRHPWR